MTREQAKHILLQDADEEIRKNGEDAVALKLGKKSWTWLEYRDSVVKDITLEGTERLNPIDALLEYEKCCVECKG